MSPPCGFQARAVLILPRDRPGPGKKIRVIMRKSPFLSDIAKQYDPKIDHVSFCLPGLIENCNGQVFARKSVEEYRILIDENLLFCANRVLWVFFHEVGHIVLGHLKLTDSERFSKKLKLEGAADEWAFNQMGIFDNQGQVKNIPCFNCIKDFSLKCRKEFK